MAIGVDIPYLEALFAEMELRHEGIYQPDADDTHPNEYATWVRALPRDEISERLIRLGFLKLIVASQPRDGAYSVRFIAKPKGE